MNRKCWPLLAVVTLRRRWTAVENVCVWQNRIKSRMAQRWVFKEICSCGVCLDSCNEKSDRIRIVIETAQRKERKAQISIRVKRHPVRKLAEVTKGLVRFCLPFLCTVSKDDFRAQNADRGTICARFSRSITLAEWRYSNGRRPRPLPANSCSCISLSGGGGEETYGTRDVVSPRDRTSRM